MSKHERRIKVTRPELQALHEARKKAIRECPDLGVQRWRKNSADFWSYKVRLRVERRDRDGSLIAQVTIETRPRGKRYIRNLRIHASLGSTSSRHIEMRQARRSV